MLYNSVFAFQSRETIVFLVMDAHQVVPLLAALQDRLPEPCLVRVELEGISVQGRDRDGSSEGWQIDDGLNLANPDRVAHGTIDEIDTLEYKLVHPLATDARVLVVTQLEKTGQAGHCALDDKQCAGNEDTMKDLVSNLPMLRQPLESGQSSAIVGRDGVVEKLDRREQMSFTLATLLLFQGSLVIQELLVIRDEDLGIKLKTVRCQRMEVEKCEVGDHTSKGSEFQETPGQDSMTSLQAFKMYSLLITILKVGSALSVLGIVRTTLKNESPVNDQSKRPKRKTHTKL